MRRRARWAATTARAWSRTGRQCWSLLAKQPDLTLQEIRGALAGHGISIGLSSLWRFLKAQNITLKKRASMPPSRTAPTSPRSGGSSSVASPRSIPTA